MTQLQERIFDISTFWTPIRFIISIAYRYISKYSIWALLWYKGLALKLESHKYLHASEWQTLDTQKWLILCGGRIRWVKQIINMLLHWEIVLVYHRTANIFFTFMKQWESLIYNKKGETILCKCNINFSTISKFHWIISSSMWYNLS